MEGLSHQESYIRELSPDRARAKMWGTGEPGGSSRSPQVNSRTVILDALHRQTGFPVDTLTDDLRLVDDLHPRLDQDGRVGINAADRLGISEAFEAAQFADVTLGS